MRRKSLDYHSIREELLLRQIQAQLNMLMNRKEPINVADTIITVSAEQQIELMKWAEIGLCAHLSSKKDPFDDFCSQCDSGE